MRPIAPILLLALAPSSCLALTPCIGGEQDETGLAVELPPVPLYPASGSIPADLQNHFVFLDEKTYELVVAFPSSLLPAGLANQAGAMVIERMPLAIEVCPVLSVSIQKSKTGGLDYRYDLKNLAIARQNLGVFALPLSDGAMERLDAPPTWRATARETRKDFEDNERAVMTFGWGDAQKKRLEQGMLKKRVEWAAKFSDDTITPGNVLGPFSLSTAVLPGMVTAYFQGSPPTVSTRSEWPLEVSGLLGTFNFIENNSVSMPTIGPKFSANTDKATIARDYLAAIEGLSNREVSLQTSPFIRELLTSLRAFSRANPIKWASKPTTRLEQQIMLGIQTSLDDVTRR